MILFDLLQALIWVLELAILARVLYSWVDPSPYPTTRLKGFLWRVTDPLLEPLRRVVPQAGGLDFTPLVALLLLQVLGAVVGQVQCDITGLC